MLKNHKYTLIGFLLALLVKGIGRLVHSLADGAASLASLPTQPHDLGMFLLVAAMLIALGFFADRNSRLRIANEVEKYRIFVATVAASQHVLNNFLNNMLFFKDEARRSQALDKKTLELLDTVIFEAAGELKKLGEISEISEKSIQETMYPK